MNVSQLILILVFLFTGLPISESAIRKVSPVSTSKEVRQIALRDTRLKCIKLENLISRKHLFHKKFVPSGTGKLTALEIITLAMVGLTFIVALFIKYTPSTLGYIVLSLSILTLLLALIGLLRKKKEGRSKAIFWAVFGGGLGYALFGYLFVTFMAD